MEHSETSVSISKPHHHTRSVIGVLVLLGSAAAVILGLAVSISYGAADIHISTVWEAVFLYNPELTSHQVIREIRLPRVLGCAMVGACFAVAGAIMQGTTRNPLADSGMLGINAGAAFVLALCFALAPGLSFQMIILYSFLGAGIGAALVYGVGSFVRGGLTPIRLVLAGAAVTALLTALSEGVALYYKIGQDLAFWYAGGAAGIKWEQLLWISPWMILAILGALLLSRSITLLSLGDEVAAGLGQRTGLVKLAGAVIVLLLAGTAVSMVGAVGFVGLIVPHLTRYLIGVDYRWVIPGSALLGSLLMVLADLASRTINPPEEVPIGAVIALIGVPFFLYIARKERREL